jgi:hypothetical protein
VPLNFLEHFRRCHLDGVNGLTARPSRMLVEN